MEALQNSSPVLQLRVALTTSDYQRLALELRRVPFDITEMIAVYQSSGRPFAEDAIAQYRPTTDE